MNKSGFITIVGKPNAGKSTLINALIGAKVAIATPRKNTTRNQIKGIRNDADSQLVFVDTPGFLKASSLLDEKMKSVIIQSMEGVDIILYLIPFWKDLDEDYLKTIEVTKNASAKKYLVLTKIDKASNNYAVAEALVKYNEYDMFDKVIPISSLKDKNMDVLLEEIKKDIPEDEIKYYDEDQKVEYSDEFYSAEIIREKALFNFSEEVPHEIFVQVEKLEDKGKVVYISANVIVSRDSLKAIVIGKDGHMIKRVGEQSRKDLERFFGKKVYLDLYVRVRKKWQDKDSIIKEI